ncbi:hypothetical protein AURDEDRAFT_174588 [Auricularia subglabra TFB-10046 SS5]|uniref:F-box domain-containing protein n=1 Tax=Auricularia subglabra (strain TFB-10046 / SS5) TaxID=717982 RepID=J0D978_AURST|nr:hypothetical protein AURDEDRAFT_174588 [Auricularia subglabra TFB-10046 SS5]
MPAARRSPAPGRMSLARRRPRVLRSCPPLAAHRSHAAVRLCVPPPARRCAAARALVPCPSARAHVLPPACRVLCPTVRLRAHRRSRWLVLRACFPEFDSQPAGDDKTTPTVEFKGPEPVVTPPMLNSIMPFSVVKLAGFIDHVLRQATGVVPAHVRFRAAGEEGTLAVYGMLETTQHRFVVPEAKDSDKYILYELRAVVMGGRCVLPVQWTRYPGPALTLEEACDSNRVNAKSIRYSQDPRFVDLFGGPPRAGNAEANEGGGNVDGEAQKDGTHGRDLRRALSDIVRRLAMSDMSILDELRRQRVKGDASTQEDWEGVLAMLGKRTGMIATAWLELEGEGSMSHTGTPEFEEMRDALRTACAQLAEDMNARAPVACLADDVLLHVLRHGDRGDRMRFAVVCRRWRSVALSTRSLWAVVHMEEGECVALLRFLFERAGTLKITADVPQSEGQFLRELNEDDELWEGVEHLKVRGGGKAETTLYLPRKAELRSLDLARGTELVIPFREAVAQLEWAHLAATPLTIWAYRGAWPFTALRTLIWRPRTWARFDSAELVGMLAGCPCLETLVMYGLEGGLTARDEVVEAIARSSPSLQRLSLMGWAIPEELVDSFRRVAHIQRYDTTPLLLGPGLLESGTEIVEIRRTRRTRRTEIVPPYDVYGANRDRTRTREELGIGATSMWPTFRELMTNQNFTDLMLPLRVWEVISEAGGHSLPRLRRLGLIGVETLELVPRWDIEKLRGLGLVGLETLELVPRWESVACPALEQLVFYAASCAFDDEGTFSSFLTRTVTCDWPLSEIGDAEGIGMKEQPWEDKWDDVRE